MARSRACRGFKTLVFGTGFPAPANHKAGYMQRYYFELAGAAIAFVAIIFAATTRLASPAPRLVPPLPKSANDIASFVCVPNLDLVAL